ncbi:class I SAM-dependent methyltransferase [Moorena sp. SIO4G3]|uniref:class I SAM-dependent methyltransferase n=1 Tax=Moorena sp. SIO4G3 TaxID=2607821 RepID=UPI00142994A9|nr:class I SAM-dependent methyltransferase [Moorena sp. SIO4G3]NEO79667.1 class I SAM-dependent methyltransferase [Moorena sp. SIO4G3]
MGKGVRGLSLKDQLPDCEIFINQKIYNLIDLVKNKKVVDIGCGFGANKKIVEDAGGTWVGVEPFEGGAHTVVGDVENLPFEDESFDIAVMDAVLEHVPNVSKAFEEVSRVLKPNGLFVGYVAFMECFHEISYSHLSFKALEHFSKINGMKLDKISGGGRFGIDYHLAVLFYPVNIKFLRGLIAITIRTLIALKSIFAYFGLRLVRKTSHNEAIIMSVNYYKLQCLRQSNGFDFVIKKI